MNKSKNDQIWVNLTLKYKEWEDFLVKGRMKMKKKINKDNQPYYDFDFTRHQYYYSFPEDHILFAHPQTQRQFLKASLQKNTQDFSQNFLDNEFDENYEDLAKKYLDPIEFHDFLRRMKEEFHHKITCLRIQKTLKIKEMMGTYGDDNVFKKAAVQLIESQIRSFLHKYITIEDTVFRLGENNESRLENRKSVLKTREIDEIKFSNLKKADIIVYLRLLQNRQSLRYNMSILRQSLKKILMEKRSEAEKIIKIQAGKKIKKKTDQTFKFKQSARKFIIKRLGEKGIDFEIENMSSLENMLSSLSYIENLQKAKKSYNKQYANVTLNYDQTLYIPTTKVEFHERLREKCLHYFPHQTYLEELQFSSDQQICYKLNNIIHLQLKVLWESYDFANEMKEKNIINIRSLLRKQLESVFTKNMNKLLNIRQHTLKMITFEDGMKDLDFRYENQTEKQSIMEYYIKNESIRYKDPTIVSHLQLLGVKKDTTLRQLIMKYVEKVLQKKPQKYESQALYYKNMTQDEKIHIINVLNHNLCLKKEEKDKNQELYIQTLNEESQPINQNLLFSYYMLIHLRCVEIRSKILQALNAQNCCILKVGSRLKLLKKYHQIPFNMDKEFLMRFTDLNDQSQNPCNFQRQIKEQVYCFEDADTDQICRENDRIEVKRIKPENPLFEGKSIIYESSLKQLEEALNKIEFLCSETIQKRENFLPDLKMTQIVDRLELIYQFLIKEKEFQNQKLNMMEQYTKIFSESIDPQCIKTISRKLFNLKKYNYIVDLTQTHFIESYENQINLLKIQTKILRKLCLKQTQEQAKYKLKVSEDLKYSNLSHKMPELSSIYFSEEIGAQEIIEQEQYENQSNAQSISYSESSALNLQKQRSFSDLSSSIQPRQYYLKATFQEILSRNSIKTVQNQNNKKEEIMNRKKKKLINETILGKYIPRGTLNKQEGYLQEIQSIFQVLDQINSFVKENEKEQKISIQLLEQFYEYLEKYEFIVYEQTFSADSLILSLNSTSRIISKFLQKPRIIPENFLCLSEKMIENLLENSNGKEVQQYRGLYICLNYVKLVELSYEKNVLLALERTPLSSTKRMNEMISNLSKSKMQTSISTIKFEDIFIGSSKLFQRLKAEQYLFPIGNFAHYYKAILFFEKNYQRIISLFVQYYVKEAEKHEQLIVELELMLKYDCWTNMLQGYHNITNKAFLERKRESLKILKSSIISNDVVKGFVDFLQQIVTKVPKFYEPKESQNPTLKSKQFVEHLQAIASAGLSLKIVGDDILGMCLKNKQIKKIEHYTKILPYLSEKISIKRLPNKYIENNFFFEGKKSLNERDQLKYQIEEKAIKHKFFKVNLTQKQNQAITKWIKKHLFERKFAQNHLNPYQIQKKKHESRHSIPTINQIEKDIPDFLSQREQYSSYMKYMKLRQWLQGQLLIFGCSLEPFQSVKLRKILYNQHELFDLFWDDNKKHLISTKELSQINSKPLEEEGILAQYKENYLNYLHLKKIYKNFVQSLIDMDLILQPQSTSMILYMGSNEFFERVSFDFSFVDSYCSEKQPHQMNSLDKFFNFMRQTNPARVKNKKRNTFHDYAEALWKQTPKKKIISIDESNRYLLNRINENIPITTKPFSTQIIKIYYKNERIKQIIQKFGLGNQQDNEELDLFIKFFENKVYNGEVTLNKNQYKIKNLAEKNFQSRREILKVKDECMKLIANSYFYESKIFQFYFGQSFSLLNREIQLKNLLNQSYYVNQVSRDPLIFKQTMNKMLAPKIKLNPYLASPLRIENYFFAGSLKLSYIDHFLNKLRNRAVLIDLAEGGTGFLLKVNELDESIESLCKSIVGFSEKQFSDRFRTFIEIYNDMRENISKLQNQNNYYRTIVKTIREREGKEVKSLVYEKLNEKLMSLLERDKVYNLTMKMMKSLENRKEKQLNQQYCERISDLQKENSILKKKFSQFLNQIIHVMKNQIQSSRDELFEEFKNKIEFLLRKKDILQETDYDIRFEEIQMHDSEILLKKLKMQKSFYQMKISTLQKSFNEKNRTLENKIIEQEKLQNLLFIERQKNQLLSEQVKKLQKCSIQIQLLKKQMAAKEEQETFQKFRLLKVNESLTGKMKRIEQERKKDGQVWSQKFNEIKKVQSTNQKNFSVQVEEKKQIYPRKSFKVRTESSFDGGSNRDFTNIWKQKWEKSERRYQNLAKKLDQTVQNYKFTKNTVQLHENLRQLMGQERANSKMNETLSRIFPQIK